MQGHNNRSPPFRQQDNKGPPHSRGYRRSTDQDGKRPGQGDFERMIYEGLINSSQGYGQSNRHASQGYYGNAEGNSQADQRTQGRQRANDDHHRTPQRDYDGRQDQQYSSPASPARAPESVLGSAQLAGQDPYAASSYNGTQAHLSQLAPGYIRPPLAKDISFKPRRRR
jgi:hypothetical protein